MRCAVLIEEEMFSEIQPQPIQGVVQRSQAKGAGDFEKPGQTMDQLLVLPGLQTQKQ